MGRNLVAQIAKYLSSHRRRKIGYWVLCSLGAVVVFCTTYALILPAITMSNEPICGMEAHTHDESCWTLETAAPETELICEEWREADAVFHTHDALCYNSEGKLICMLEELERHVHTADCYVEQMELICEKTAGEPEEPSEAPAAPRPAVKAHTHTDACYSFQRGELTCALEEAEGHTHTDACYESQPSGEMIQICPYEEGQIVDSLFDADNGTFFDITHTHGPECYETAMDHVLVCGQEEFEGHLHSDDCYDWERVLTCPETETPAEGPEEQPEEIVEVHVHSEDCYRITAIQVCGQEELEFHTHGPECYDTIQVDDGMGGFETREVLTCELPVVIEHQHTEACVQQNSSPDEGGERQIMVRTCGLTVHVHTDDCFLPAGPDPDPYYCGLAEHFHTAECFFESGELRCHIPEHRHEDACLDPDSAPTPVYPLFPEERPSGHVCGLEEHRHTDICWLDGELVCGLEEHVHSESCLPAQDDDGGAADGPGEGATLVCGKEEHVHDSSCRSDGLELICGKEGHVHDRTCWSDYAPDEEGGGLDPDDPGTEPETVVLEDVEYPFENEEYSVIFRVSGTAKVLNGEADSGQSPYPDADPWDGFDTAPSGPSQDQTVKPEPTPVKDPEPVKRPESETVRDPEPVQEPEPVRHPETVQDPEPESTPPQESEPVSEPEPVLPDESVLPEPGFMEEDEILLDEEEDIPLRGRVLSMNGEAFDDLDEIYGSDRYGSNNDDSSVTGNEGATSEDPWTSAPSTSPDDWQTDFTNQNSSSSLTAEDLIFSLERIEEDDEDYQDVLEDLTAGLEEEEILLLEFLQVVVTTTDGRTVDLSDCTITMTFTPKPELTAALEEQAAVMTLDEHESDETPAEDEAETSEEPNVVYSLRTKDEIVTTEAAVTSDAAADTAADIMSDPDSFADAAGPWDAPSSGDRPQTGDPDAGIATLSLDVDVGQPMALTASNNPGPNPHFTVQYYAYLDTAKQDNEKGKLTVIDTSGKNKPVNGESSKNHPTVKLVLENGKVASSQKLDPVYRPHIFEYTSAPGLKYFNIVTTKVKNNYKLAEIWVLTDEAKKADAEKENAADKAEFGLKESDWTIYKDVDNTWFTNREQTAKKDPRYIWIKEDTVIRLVYRTTENNEHLETPVNFYDYDVTDGKIYDSAADAKAQTNGKNTSTQTNGKTYAYVKQQGINSPSNFGTATKGRFAFGNGPGTLGTGLGDDTFGGFKMNQANTTTYGNCTFGLVKGMQVVRTDSGKYKVDVEYAAGITAPQLFGIEDKAVVGKTAITNINQLKFRRVGDTYTLTSVPGTNTNNLDSFSEMVNWRKETVYYNLFWPMDSASTWGANGHDLKFGDNSLETMRVAEGINERTFPKSDNNGTDHNAYFSMNFAVEFELTNDYVGPLEYYFFGDDDMWVFLSEVGTDGTLSNHQLVCDIGGIHSAVGEYVNLWDYIGEKPKYTEPAPVTDATPTRYRLTFFYTERGASGSTCWMQYTLPTVVGVDLETEIEKKLTNDTGALWISKVVEGIETPQEFKFILTFDDSEVENDGGKSVWDDFVAYKRKHSGETDPDDIFQGAAGEDGKTEISLETIASGEVITLAHDEEFVIAGIPKGAKYTITEVDKVPEKNENGEYVEKPVPGIPGYNTEFTTTVREKNESGAMTQTSVTAGSGPEATGQIFGNSIITVAFTNHSSYLLPSTGGPTARMYTLGGAALLLAAAGCLVYKNRSRRRGAADQT